MVSVVLTEPVDICVIDKGCGSMSAVVLTQRLLYSSDGDFGSRTLGRYQKSHTGPVKLWFKSKAGFPRDVPDTFTFRETERQGGSDGDSEVEMEPHND